MKSELFARISFSGKGRKSSIVQKVMKSEKGIIFLEKIGSKEGEKKKMKKTPTTQKIKNKPNKTFRNFPSIFNFFSGEDTLLTLST